jgi:uncharacterized membrane protein YfcA
MKLVSYFTGACAFLIVALATLSAVIYAATHNRETLHNLATGTLNGLGMSIGGLIGSALVFRFKAARHFIRKVLKEDAD